MNMVPDWQAQLLEKGKGTNYGLYFSRMTAWRPYGGELKAEYLVRVEQTKKGPKEEYAPDIERLGLKSLHIFPASSVVLEAIHTRQTAILKSETSRGGMVWEFRARLLSPFVSGLGSGHPTETGMILDRNSGLPYIPASAVKGVLRLAHALDIAEQYVIDHINIPQDKDGDFVIDDSLPTMRRYFGDTNTGKADSVRGQLVFLDAFPASTPAIKIDIMNPHFGGYYSRKQGPLETENPIPVKFLTVAPETEFIFRCFSSSLPMQGQSALVVEVFRPFDAKDEQSVIAMFTRALNQLGFGGKTSIGYGRFELTATETNNHFKHQIERDAEQRRLDTERRLKEKERIQYPWRQYLPDLAETTDWGTLRQKGIDNSALKTILGNPKFPLGKEEVGSVIKSAAERIRNQNLRKWNEDKRDKVMTDYLSPLGIAWETKFDTSNLDAPPRPSVFLECIERLQSFAAYRNEKIKINQLDKTSAELLKSKFNSWGVPKRSPEYEQIVKKLKKLH